jgi:hypothetical protein
LLADLKTLLLTELTEVVWPLKAVEDIIVPLLSSSLSLELRQSWLGLASWLLGDNSLWCLGFAHDED